MSVPVICRMFDCLQAGAGENMLAKALYDNAAESSDELSFRKGDILTVLERDTQGLDGWWLCSLHGRQGIVPGNRLKLLMGMQDKTPPLSQIPLPPRGKSSPSSQYTAMHPAQSTNTSFPSVQDSVYMLPTGSTSLDIYQAPPGPPAKSHHRAPPQDVYQVPPGSKHALQDVYQVPGVPKSNIQDIYQVPAGFKPNPQDVYQLPTGPKPALQDVYQVPAVIGGQAAPQDIYQIPPSMEKRNWTVPNPPAKVIVPMRVGQVYVYDPAEAEQDEYDVPRNLPSSHVVYDTLPNRNQYNEQVYDTPPMVVKGPSRLDDGQDTYDTPPSVHRGHLLTQLTVYDVPPSVSKDSLGQDETYDLPPPFPKLKVTQPTDDVYDVPPPQLSSKRGHAPSAQDIYDVPTSGSREVTAPRGGQQEDYVYDVPPQVVRDSPLDPTEVGGVKQSVSGPAPESARLELEPEQAMERLSRLQQAVEGAVSQLGEKRETETQPAAVERVRMGVWELLEFGRGALVNAGQAPDRMLQAKLGRHVQRLEESYQELEKHWQVTPTSPPPASVDLERLAACVRAIPDHTRQLASFLHGNAALLFRRTRQPPLPPLPPATDAGGYPSGSSGPLVNQTGPVREHIQSRPLPPPPKIGDEVETAERPYETADEGWMEDYDYVHLQGKEEFEKNQKQLLEKGNTIREDKTQLEQHQLKKIEQLEQEVIRPIDDNLAGWTPPPQPPQPPQRSRLCTGDRQLLLFYLEQCEANVTALTGAVDAFFTSITANHPPKVFVAHSKLVILSAHKLVFIGDTLSRQAKSAEIRACAAEHSAALCQRLKDIVLSTKTAALQFPSAAAARDVMERVGELATCTQQFCLSLGQLAIM